MKNDAENVKYRETGSTSRLSSSESEETDSSAYSTTSVTSEIASMLVSETLDQAAANMNELTHSISRWEAEEQKSETGQSYGTDLKPGSPCPESPTGSMCSIQDIKDTTKADLHSGPPGLMDVEDDDFTPEEKPSKPPSKPSTTR